MFSRARLDALSDGIFAVAMTRLVLDVRLPEDFHPHDAAELIALSFVNPANALWAFALNFAAPVMRVWSGRRMVPD